MLKVAFVCVELPGSSHVGGAPRYGFRLASELASLVDLTVITAEGCDAVPGAKMEYIKPSRGRFSRYYLLPFRVRSAIKRGEFDVVHAFGEDWAIPKRKALLVRTFLGTSWSEAVSSKGLRKWNHFVLYLLEKYSQIRSDIRISIGPESHEAFRCDYLVPPVVPLSVKAGREPTEEPSVIFIGSFLGRKRGELAQRVVRDVEQLLNQPVRLVVVGPASDREMWDKRVEHISGASDVEVQKLISNAWMLLSTSSYEGFGIPVFEALTLGVPAVSTSNPGSEYLSTEYGDGGPFVLCRDDDELVPAVLARLTKGPYLESGDVSFCSEISAKLINQASPEFMVKSIYQMEPGSKRLRD